MSKPTDIQLARRALQCRAIRLWINQNPGKTKREIGESLGMNRVVESRLYKMLEMGIIRKSQNREQDGTCPIRWFVIPQ